MSHVTSDLTTAKELAKLTGLSKRQIQRIAAAGDVPDCVPSPDGYHRTFPITDGLVAWVKDEAERSNRRRKYLEEPRIAPAQKPQKRVHNEVMEATTKAHALRLYLREMADKVPVERWDAGMRQAIKADLEPIVEFWKKL